MIWEREQADVLQPSETAALIIEPILGEGGYVVPPQGMNHPIMIGFASYNTA